MNPAPHPPPVRPAPPPPPPPLPPQMPWGSPGRHRRPARVRVGAVLAGLVVAALVVVAGGAITDSQLDTDQRLREFVVTGSMGEPVSARTFQATVLSVETAAEFALAEGGGPAFDTAGVWVLVRLRVEADTEPTRIRYAAVRDSQGRAYWATERVGLSLVDGTHRLEPGIPVEGELAFEVPPEVADDLTLRLSDSGGVDLRMQTVAEVGLPVEEASVTEVLSEPEPVELDTVPVVVAADPTAGAG